jgi:hypothetical protein
MKPMDEATLNSYLDAEKSASLGYLYGDLNSERERAIEYYHGRVDLAVPEGRSDVVSTDVRGTPSTACFPTCSMCSCPQTKS